MSFQLRIDRLVEETLNTQYHIKICSQVSAFLNDVIILLNFIEKEMPIDFEQHVLSKRLTHRYEGT